MHILMASYKFLFSLAILAIVTPSTSATDFIVGDDRQRYVGPINTVDYQAWAQGKLFYVGDNLVFNYPEGAHNVLKVNGTGFKECAAPAETVALTSGKDVINLATPGRKWYICGKLGTELGPQKLVITVMPASFAPSPGPATSVATPSVNGANYGWFLVAIGVILRMVMA